MKTPRSLGEGGWRGGGREEEEGKRERGRGRKKKGGGEGVHHFRYMCACVDGANDPCDEHPHIAMVTPAHVQQVLMSLYICMCMYMYMQFHPPPPPPPTHTHPFPPSRSVRGGEVCEVDAERLLCLMQLDDVHIPILIVVLRFLVT